MTFACGDTDVIDNGYQPPVGLWATHWNKPGNCQTSSKIVKVEPYVLEDHCA
jgi:hypothetical protein